MTDMKGKGMGELVKVVEEGREQLRQVRFGVAGSHDRNVKKRKSIRKDIARALTELNAQKA